MAYPYTHLSRHVGYSTALGQDIVFPWGCLTSCTESVSPSVTQPVLCKCFHTAYTQCQRGTEVKFCVSLKLHLTLSSGFLCTYKPVSRLWHRSMCVCGGYAWMWVCMCGFVNMYWLVVMSSLMCPCWTCLYYST